MFLCVFRNQDSCAHTTLRRFQSVMYEKLYTKTRILSYTCLRGQLAIYIRTWGYAGSGLYGHGRKEASKNRIDTSTPTSWPRTSVCCAKNARKEVTRTLPRTATVLLLAHNGWLISNGVKSARSGKMDRIRLISIKISSLLKYLQEMTHCCL